MSRIYTISGQVEVSKEQTEKLLTAAFDGFEAILSFKGFREEDIRGETTGFDMNTSLDVRGSLSSLISTKYVFDVAGFMPNPSFIYGPNRISSDVKDIASINIDSIAGEYIDAVDAELNNLIKKFDDLKQHVAKGVHSFKNYATQLSEAYKSGSIDNVAEALSECSAVLRISNSVNVKKVYTVIRELREASLFFKKYDFHAATDLFNDLSNALDEARVPQLLFSVGGRNKMLAVEKPFRVEPDNTQVYNGALDYKLVARNILLAK